MSSQKTERPTPTRIRHRVTWIVGSGLLVLVLATLMIGVINTLSPLGPQVVQAAEPQAEPVADYADDIRPFFVRYCFDCHEGESAEEGLALDGYKDVESIQANRERWEKVFDRLRVGAMPPADSDQPRPEERERVVAWLDHTLFYVDCDLAPDPGRVTIRRLNRAEYNNTIRDLVGVDFHPADDFPSDDVGYGFDNIGDVLSVPPLLIEKYLDAAEEISEAAIVTADPDYRQQQFAAREMKHDGSVSNGPDGTAAFPSRGTVSAEVDLAAGEYRIQIEAGAQQAGDEPAKMRLQLGDDREQVFEIRGDNRSQDWYEVVWDVAAGKRRIAVSFTNDYYNPDEKEDRNLYVRTVTLEGPLGLPRELPESHTQLIAVTPDDNHNVAEAAKENVRQLLYHAFRRPPTDEEVEQYAGFVEMTTERDESFERGMQIALQAVLCSPQFLFRVETDKRPDDPDARHSLNDFELATRLSYFLWSSMPDDELFRLAEENRLHEDAVLEQQVRRMLAAPRSYALIDNFGGQWLNLRRLDTEDVAPAPEEFPEWNEELRTDMAKETELFLASVVREDRSIMDLLNGRYSFVNERLAGLYGIDGVEGEEFRRVDLADGRRAGVLTQASILTLTSYPTRTSPVRRGKWVLENLLGDEPPDPPPLVPGLEETQAANPDLPLRKQLEIHRSDPTCASCHVTMDEIGFGLENFDAIGRWREQDGPFPVDAAGTLPTGEMFRGPMELIGILEARKSEFAGCLAEKLLTYALGRGLEYYDQCTIDDIVEHLQQTDMRFSTLVTAIVKSEPFRMRRGDESSQTAKTD